MLDPMPIATCFTSADRPDLDPDEIVDEWARRSGIASGEMTVNVVSAAQGGEPYAVMAWLYLPSLWSREDVTALGEGLAAALAATFGIEPADVQVITSIVQPGFVVEAGQTLRW